MKKLYTFLLITFNALVLYAQPKTRTLSITPRIGTTLSEPTGTAEAILYEYAVKYKFSGTIPGDLPLGDNLVALYAPHRKVGLTAGVELQYQVNPIFACVAGLDFAQLKSSVDVSDEKSTCRFQLHSITNSINYLQLPLTAKLYLHKCFAVQSGLQFNWKLKSNVDVDCVNYGEHIKTEGEYVLMKETNDAKYFGKMHVPHMHDISRLGVSLPMGLSFEFNNVCIDASYNISITRSAKGRFYSEQREYRNSTIMLTLGYRFPLSKKQ